MRKVISIFPKKDKDYAIKEAEYKLFYNYTTGTKYDKDTLLQYLREFSKFKRALKKGKLIIDIADNIEGVVLTFKGIAAKDIHLKAFVFCSSNERDFINIKDLTKYPNREDLELQYYPGDRYSPAAYAYGVQKPKRIDWM